MASLKPSLDSNGSNVEDGISVFAKFRLLADASAATHSANSNSSELSSLPQPIQIATKLLMVIKIHGLFGKSMRSVTGCILKLQRRYFLSSNEKPRNIIIILSAPYLMAPQ